MALVTKGEIRAKLKALPEWHPSGKSIDKKLTFKSFLLAIEFVNRVAAAADRAGHHPDITVNYNVGTLSLSKHSEGGVTEGDLDLAYELDRLETASPA